MNSTPRTNPGSLAAVTRLPSVNVPAVLGCSDAVVVDLRAPGEFAEDHLPGARNVPLFDDDERALVGLLYHRSSPEKAFQQALDVVVGKVQELVATIAEVARLPVPEVDPREAVIELAMGGLAQTERRLEVVSSVELPARPLVLHCWRGGLRSQSVAALVRYVGLADAVILAGGYKAYRARVREELESCELPPAVVLRGLTGVGKTLVLRELERLRPGWTLDLEGAAGHRSSLLGMVGLEPVTQKTFESRLADRLRAGFPGGVAVYEGESRKVGDAIVPPRIWESLRGGVNVELVADVETRIRVLMDDYLACESNRVALRDQLALVEERMRPRTPLVELFDAGRDEEVVALLLEHYYDPLYRHSEREHEYALTIDSADPARAAREIAAWIR